MRIIIVENYEELSRKAASLVASQVILDPNSVLGLATGSTPVGMYKNLVNMHNEGMLDFSNVRTFNLDEYYGLQKTHEQSYNYYMRKNLFDFINIKKENTNIPDGMVIDYLKESKKYEEKIKDAGGIDLQVLGIGRNGHIGFNEPDVKFEAVTHIVELDEDTIQANARFFDKIEDVPKKAISMGIKTIMHVRKIILLASGESKADAMYRSIKGPINPEIPASVLQLHPDVVYILDKKAASKLIEMK